MIGQNGLTDAVINEIDIALNAHELIKVRAKGSDKDGNPCNQIDFYREACRLSNSKMPEIYKINEINMTDMQKSFWLSSKHIVSSVLKNEFDYKFIHPDFKSGLKAIWKMNN